MTQRVILHKFDPSVPAPGGIDTCIRGIIKYSDPSEEISILGVDGGGSGTALGEWSTIELYGRQIKFMPLVRLDPGNQVRRIPHSVSIAQGLLRYRARIPRVEVLQTHRADLGLIGTAVLNPQSHDYFIHTQESGILGSNSDSFWRRAAPLHRAIERSVVRRAQRVRVFNQTYAELVAKWNSATRASPTWWDPALIPLPETRTRDESLLWVGRLEEPKVPSLALDVLRELRENHPDNNWRLTIVGGGNLGSTLRQQALDAGLHNSVRFAGRLRPDEVMAEMARASVLLMTSVAGYEGFPRVLVEGLANGLSAVVTMGADTGGLVKDGINGYRTESEPHIMAARVIDAIGLDPASSRKSVAHLAAPRVVDDLLS